MFNEYEASSILCGCPDGKNQEPESKTTCWSTHSKWQNPDFTLNLLDSDSTFILQKLQSLQRNVVLWCSSWVREVQPFSTLLYRNFQVQDTKSICSVLNFVHYDLYTCNRDTSWEAGTDLWGQRKWLWLSSRERGRSGEDMLGHCDAVTILYEQGAAWLTQFWQQRIGKPIRRVRTGSLRAIKLGPYYCA